MLPREVLDALLLELFNASLAGSLRSLPNQPILSFYDTENTLVT